VKIDMSMLRRPVLNAGRSSVIPAVGSRMWTRAGSMKMTVWTVRPVVTTTTPINTDTQREHVEIYVLLSKVFLFPAGGRLPNGKMYPRF